ncbi:MAG: nickel pincer cofactor biosynthesis protein LarC [Candidatus Omnitrophota bacterium]
MSVAYIDCSSGISGDMLLAAFLDAGFKPALLKKEIDKLKLKGVRLRVTGVKRHHIMARKLCFDVRDAAKTRFTAREIENIIKNSGLCAGVKDDSLKVFRRLLLAEGRIHGRRSETHLHQLGDIDTVLDITGVCSCLCQWGIERVYYVNPAFGCGAMDAGYPMSVPAPATLEIMKGIPVRFSGVRSELITPTGAAILRELGRYCEHEPVLRVKRIGYGAGERDLPGIPNVLRIAVGEEARNYAADSVTVIEAAIDDTMPVVYTYLYERLFGIGALDVCTAGIQMKKQRPGVLLTVLVPHTLVRKAADIILKETGTNGIRYYPADRLILDRKMKRVRTKWGMVDVKISGAGHDVYKASPEFESCRSLAAKTGASFMAVYDAAKRAALGILCALFISACASADTVTLKNGREIKGIVVEEYNDRLVMSTAQGEIEIKKDSVRSVKYDLEEQNLVAMGDKYMASHQYDKAFYFYDKAKKINPDYADALEGVNYLNSYLFRQAGARKAMHVQWRQEVESFQNSKPVTWESNESQLIRFIGMELSENTRNEIIISKVYSGMPAAEAGIEKGDCISSIWGRLTKYMSVEDVVADLVKPGLMEIQITVDRIVPVTPDTLTQPQFDYVFEGLTLKNVTNGSKAYLAGFRDGDMVNTIRGQSVRYTPLKEVIKELKLGPTVVGIRRKITIWRTKEG